MALIRGLFAAVSGGATTGTSITLTAPAGTVAGDQLLVLISNRDQIGVNWTPPAGWVSRHQLTDGNGEGRIYSARYGTDVTGTSWTWTSGSDTTTDKWAVAGVVLNGSEAGAYLSSVSAIRGTTAVTDSPVGPITTSQPAILIGLSGDRIDTGSTWTWPTGWTEQVDNVSDTGTNAVSATLAMYGTVPAPAGSYSVTPVATVASANGWAAIVAFALPDPAPSTLDKLKLGTALVGLRVGPDVASKAYLGTTQVWP